MRILLISHHFPPTLLGGADLYASGIADELRRSGHDVWVLCVEDLHDPKASTGEVRTADIPYKGLPVRRLYFDWTKMQDPYGSLYVENPAIRSLTQEYIKEIEPDIVHITACDYVTNAVITASKLESLPVVLTLTGKWHICPKATLQRWDGDLCSGRQPGMTCLRCMFGRTKVYRLLSLFPPRIRQWLINLSSRYASLFRSVGSLNFIHAIERRNREFERTLSDIDLVISPSHCHRDIFSRSGLIPIDRIRYSPHGRRVQLAAKGRAKSRSPKIRFGYTGQIVSHKGADTLLKAFSQLGANGQAELHLYGRMDPDSEFGRRVRTMAEGNDSVILRGPFEHSEIGDVMRGIDVLTVPSNCIENSPLTIAEAHAARTPVVGSDVCGISEHIANGVSGLLFRRGDSDHLASQMQRFLDEPELLDRLRAGIPAVRSTADEVAELERMYAALVR